MSAATAKLPRIADLAPGDEGFGFFLCARKDLRAGRSGPPSLHVLLQDVTGTVTGRLEGPRGSEFEAGDFVRVEGRVDRPGQRLEIVITQVRRVEPDADRPDGFDEAACIAAAPRPLDDMWRELSGLVARVQNSHVRALLTEILARHGSRLRIWPAAQSVHHAYRGGLLEHILKVAETGESLAGAYGADADLVIAGAILHDIGKLRELDYELTTRYSLEGNLLGHITMGVGMVQDAAASLEGFPSDLLLHLTHLVVSHHGSRELGSPVVPMSVEAIILSAADDLDATLHQVRRHQAESAGDGGLTPYHPRLGRAFLKPSGR